MEVKRLLEGPKGTGKIQRPSIT
jgi:hypothetical protein